MPKYIIVNTATGEAVQSWSFAGRKHIAYCTGPEWAMKYESEESAGRTLDYLEKNFGVRNLAVLKATFATAVTFG